MLRPRIIPSLLVSNGGLVKTVRFGSPKYVGDPINAVRIFNEKESDELIILDIDATTKGLEPNFSSIAQWAAECRMPLCYGGGIKSAHQAKRIIGLGVEKVAISSGMLENSKLVTQTAEEIGSQSVVAVIDVKRDRDGFRVYTHNGKCDTGRDPFELAQELSVAGVGEIVVNAIDQDGVMQGYDLDLARRMRGAMKLPMTVLGGAGSLDHISDLIRACGVVGAGAGSLFVFKGVFRAVLINYPSLVRKDELVRISLGMDGAVV